MENYRFHRDGAVYFITFSVVEWLPVFVSAEAGKIVTDSLNYCHDHKGLRTNAYVIMPTHLHAICFHETFDGEKLQQTLADFRKFTGRHLSDFGASHLPRCFTETFRSSSGADRERRFWQPTRHPEVIESEGFWQVKLDYLHANPCRKGLVLAPEHWRFSSAGFWLGKGQGANDVKLSAIVW